MSAPDAPYLNCDTCRGTTGRAGCPTHRDSNVYNDEAGAYHYTGSRLVMTHCIHGLDLRLNPRCYLCQPAPDPLREDPNLITIRRAQGEAVVWVLEKAGRGVTLGPTGQHLAADMAEKVRAALAAQPAPDPLRLTPGLFLDLGEVLAAHVYESDGGRYICRICDSDVTTAPHSDDCEVKHLREWTFAVNKRAQPADAPAPRIVITVCPHSVDTRFSLCLMCEAAQPAPDPLREAALAIVTLWDTGPFIWDDEEWAKLEALTDQLRAALEAKP